MLSDWERIAGLPDQCIGSLSATEAQRRNDLVARLSDIGSSNPSEFITMVENLGFTNVQVEEFSPSSPGPGGVVTDTDDWWFVWRISVEETSDEVLFRTGDARSGDLLLDFGDNGLECYINTRKPAHTLVLFAYGVTP